MKRFARLTMIACMAAVSLTVGIACGGGDDDDETATAPAATSTRASTATAASSPTATAGTPAPVETPPQPTAVAQPTQAPPSGGPPSSPTTPPSPPPPPPPAAVALTVVARDVKFIPTSLTAPAGTTVTVTLDNQDAGVIHDIAFFSGSASLGATALITGPATASTTFTVGAPGRYAFKCSVHPQDMLGTLTVQ